ncbi:glutamine amidotransferase [Beggiatoa leptomitoformis]|uniref:Glutamine amidotransferase n=1 Tax=Beggiatoa leptomitoformis TaxID=288004 RepID=A0A2N9YFB0_9GAMM|nr:glutamine amidotransferase [Beggiatoa leptomitoformis]ALG68530.1 glutamine amidotransferase [Beggiatoa leptomitoformis]AUI69126.1 glutamine amidotransferase [Beggiatoa leptomitoformis]
MKKLFLVKTGKTFPALIKRRGDFDQWFIQCLGFSPDHIEIVEVFEGEPLPDELDDVAGVLVTGSPAMVTDRERWSELTAKWLCQVHQSSIPLLGICYGHQLIAHALGGKVANNPNGFEAGIVEIHLNEACDTDILLKELPKTLSVHAMHRQVVVTLPPETVILASNPHTDYQAYKIGETTWGLQFHPEFDADIMRTYLAEREAVFIKEGIDVETARQNAADTPYGDMLLKRFATLVQTRI